MPGGRPRKYSDQFRADLLKKFQEYIDKTDCPFIVNFAVQNDIYKELIYDFDEFSQYIKKARTKCEGYWLKRLQDGS